MKGRSTWKCEREEKQHEGVQDLRPSGVGRVMVPVAVWAPPAIPSRPTPPRPTTSALELPPLALPACLYQWYCPPPSVLVPAVPLFCPYCL